MLTALVEGPLRARAAGAPLVRRVVKIAGRIESQTDEALQPLYREWAEATPPINATILAALGQIELHLSTRAASTEVALAALDARGSTGERRHWRGRLQHGRQVRWKPSSATCWHPADTASRSPSRARVVC